ncbi:hemin-degrading factor [Aquamicrobium sp. LC103]|uniref:hemin-degrading factor n=1 Tax=Aquamicrobium sp. LC103 TaxID=1120658 RepID=UPI00063EABAA|nr:hemin-degrading factor [Aquamicrobium sp. LC103]TKT79131.1 hemin-degrading factor [Aquamicrobium sp. LC103]
MTVSPKPAPGEIRRARLDNPKMRERELAVSLGISEADFVAAHCGEGVARIEPRVNDILPRLGGLGEVMALTRNESAVHEKIGVYEKISTGEHASLVLGSQIDLRIFPKSWAFGFAVEKSDGNELRRSLQFFDKTGEAVHKVHLRPDSDITAYENLVSDFLSADQSQTIETSAISAAEPLAAAAEAGARELRERWGAMTDVHQFFGMLKALKLERRQALAMVGEDYAWQLDGDALGAMMNHAVQEVIPIMCFVGNRGCIQIHTGPIANVKSMGPWINVLDPTFHLHLRLDHVREVWAVRKPSKDGYITSLEAYDAGNQLIIQFFGERHEGETEREDWRMIAENLPRLPRSTAA